MILNIFGGDFSPYLADGTGFRAGRSVCKWLIMNALVIFSTGVQRTICGKVGFTRIWSDWA
jgi:hypothetical protein